MIKEFFSFFCIGYLYSSVFLLPFFSFYFMIDPSRFSFPLMHRLHKWVLLITIIIPFSFSIFMFSSSLNTLDKNLSPLQSIDSSNVQIKTPDNPKTRLDQINVSVGYIDTIQDYHQMALGLLYYLIDFLTWLILIGAIVFLTRLLIQKLYLIHIDRSNSKMKPYLGYQIISSKQITLPFSVGLRHQKVYLPDGLPQGDRDIILNHELNHFHRHHHYWSLLESLIFHIFWFNPVSHLIRKRGILFREMECDTDTIQTIDKYIYSKTLLSSAESLLSSRRLGLMVQQWIQKGVLKKRLENILNNKKGKHRRFISFGFFLVLIVSVGIFVFISFLDDETLEKNLIQKAKTEYTAILQNRESIVINDVPEHLIQVLLFNEDSGFYNHQGISVKAFLRAIVNNLSGGPLQGGSTISQQLSKILCVQTRDRTLNRKLKQVKAAQVLEKYFTKNQILEMYLNSVYFGQGAFGVEMASNNFFNHPCSELTIAESALLIQSLAKPKFNNLLSNPKIAMQRAHSLLYRMVSHNLLEQSTADESIQNIIKKLGDRT